MIGKMDYSGLVWECESVLFVGVLIGIVVIQSSFMVPGGYYIYVIVD